VCACICLQNVCKHGILYLLRKFHQIYTVGASGDKDELIRFQGEKVEAEGHDYSTRPNVVKNLLFGPLHYHRTLNDDILKSIWMCYW